jgi:hypothetical protein
MTGNSASAGVARLAFVRPRAVCYSICMCLICVDFEKGKLTTKEARRALGEMAEKIGPEHVAEVEQKLAEAEAEDATP